MFEEQGKTGKHLVDLHLNSEMFLSDPFILLLLHSFSCRPTYFPAVPRLLNRIYDKVCVQDEYCILLYKLLVPTLLILYHPNDKEFGFYVWFSRLSF